MAVGITAAFAGLNQSPLMSMSAEQYRKAGVAEVLENPRLAQAASDAVREYMAERGQSLEDGLLQFSDFAYDHPSYGTLEDYAAPAFLSACSKDEGGYSALCDTFLQARKAEWNHLNQVKDAKSMRTVWLVSIGTALATAGFVALGYTLQSREFSQNKPAAPATM